MFSNLDLQKLIFGRLTLEAIPYHEPILIVTFLGVAVGGIGLLSLLTYYRVWGYLWSEWFTSVDHKKIGVMYIVLALVMLVRGFSDALLMRTQQAVAFNGNPGYLPPHHYDQVFTAHGVIMIFFMAMPFVTGLMNFVVPLQIGARDVAFPFLNNFSFWMTVSGAVTIMMSLFVGEFARTGWLAMTPLSEASYSPGVGVDYYIWSLQIAGIGTLLSGVNLIATIVKMRAPGMSMMKMPVFVWTSLCTNILIVAAFPVLTAVLALLSLDRYMGTNFFTNDLGGNPMMYINLIWIWGHPEVYILILPVFGVFSEVVSTFSGKRLFGYVSMVYATVVITILAYLVWLHHFFTMGSGASVNSFFGITTMIISIPTGAKIFNWLFTMYRGRIRFELPMLWTMAFMITFVIGGMTGVLLAVPPADFMLHNSLFLVAHFHNVIIGGTFFGVMAGVAYWWPKAFGFKLDPFWGKISFGLWVSGFYFAFMPLYVLGLMGVTRRLNHFDDPSLQIWFVIACFGALLIAGGIAAFFIQIAVSIRDRDILADVTGDPWNGRTLEWSTSSPPPEYNFAFTPIVHDLDAWTDMKRRGYDRPLGGYKPIHMPRSTWAGIVLAGIATIFSFAMIWYIWWLAALCFASIVLVAIGHTFNYNREFYIPAEDVARVEGGEAGSWPDACEAKGMTRSSNVAVDDEDLHFYVTEDHGHAEGGTMLGFWLYLMSDCLIFAVLFATYAVLGRQYAAGPSPADLFELPTVALNTAMLLFSSITYGFAMLMMEKGSRWGTIGWLVVTALFGAAFVGIELNEFAHLIADGAGPQRSAFLSAFFTLVSTHGLHVTFGIIWMVVLMIQVLWRGLIPENKRRLMCLSLFWHFLDVVWIGVFSFVYLISVLP